MEIYPEFACHTKCVGDYPDRTSFVSDFPPKRSAVKIAFIIARKEIMQ